MFVYVYLIYLKKKNYIINVKFSCNGEEVHQRIFLFQDFFH